jgi:8-oxo-dGTP diphosphatase
VRDRYPVPVALALLERDGRWLVRRREPGKHLEGHWEFPGGKIAFGETVQDALTRECVEEVGVHPEAPRLMGVVDHVYAEDDVHVLLLAYHARVPLDAVVTDASARWVTLEEARALRMPAANGKVLALIDERGSGDGGIKGSGT